MPRSKIQSEQEVIKWIEEGKTYFWMVDQYLEKYNIETTPSMFAAFRRRRGLPRRNVRNDDLIPWLVKEEHRYAFPILNLRREARRRAGWDVPAEHLRELEGWLIHLEQGNLVVHYEPDTEQGWFYVEPRPGIDTDIIRVPDRKTGIAPAD